MPVEDEIAERFLDWWSDPAVVNFLFWNLNGKLLQDRVAALVRNYDIDVLVLTECVIPPTSVSGVLADGTGQTYTCGFTLLEDRGGLEIEKAVEEEKKRKAEGRVNWRVVFPIMVDESFLTSRDHHMAALRKDRKASDSRHWKDNLEFESALTELVRGLRDS